jgi:GNAT superfamily N-acetyltransferase
MKGNPGRDVVRAATIRVARSARDVDLAREVLIDQREWLAAVGLPDGYAGHAGVKEYADPVAYYREHGVFLLAEQDGTALGGVGLRRTGNREFDLRRFFVRRDARGCALGRMLLDASIGAARMFGQQRIVFDALPGTMDDAIGTCSRIGFAAVERRASRYRNGVVFALDLEVR